MYSADNFKLEKIALICSFREHLFLSCRKKRRLMTPQANLYLH